MSTFVFLVVSFATWITLHVAVVSALARRMPRWRAPIALVIVPLAPLFAFRAGVKRRAIAWSASFVVYLVALALAWR